MNDEHILYELDRRNARITINRAAYDARHRGQIVYPPAFDGI